MHNVKRELLTSKGEVILPSDTACFCKASDGDADAVRNARLTSASASTRAPNASCSDAVVGSRLQGGFVLLSLPLFVPQAPTKQAAVNTDRTLVGSQPASQPASRSLLAACCLHQPCAQETKAKCKHELCTWSLFCETRNVCLGKCMRSTTFRRHRSLAPCCLGIMEMVDAPASSSSVSLHSWTSAQRSAAETLKQYTCGLCSGDRHQKALRRCHSRCSSRRRTWRSSPLRPTVHRIDATLTDNASA